MNIKPDKITVPSKYSFLQVALLLTIIGAAIIAIGIPLQNSVAKTLLNAFGGGTITLGWIDILHEWAVARHEREKFMILGDVIEKGIKRLSDPKERNSSGEEALKRTKELSVMGFSMDWLLNENLRRLEEMIAHGYEIKIMMANPLSPAVINRYNNDEPKPLRRGREGIALNINQMYHITKKSEHAVLKVFNNYPVSTVTIYDEDVYVGPVLYLQTPRDNMTTIYRRHSSGAQAYINHFNKIFESETASTIVDQNYMRDLYNEFKNFEFVEL
jgi:hypothetical protein